MAPADMTRINSNALQEGMIVAADVRNADNTLLLPAGCTLTSRHLSILNAWGIAEVDIQLEAGAETPDDPLAQIDPAVLAQLTEELRRSFWQLDAANPVAMEVFNLILRRHVLRQAASAAS